MGGLVGLNDRGGTITNSYATGSVSGISSVGGLVGLNYRRSTITNSYWDINTSGIITSSGGTSKATVELQSPTAPGNVSGEIYYSWSSDDWDFGNTKSYPALRYSKVGDVDTCDVDPKTALPHCGILLSNQSNRDRGLSLLLFVVDDKQQDNDRVFGNRPFSSLLFNYNVLIPKPTKFELRPYAVNSTAIISITQAKDLSNTNYFDGRSSGMLSLPIPISERRTTLTIIVKNNPDDSDPARYRFIADIVDAIRVRIKVFLEGVMQ